MADTSEYFRLRYYRTNTEILDFSEVASISKNNDTFKIRFRNNSDSILTTIASGVVIAAAYTKYIEYICNAKD